MGLQWGESQGANEGSKQIIDFELAPLPYQKLLFKTVMGVEEWSGLLFQEKYHSKAPSGS